MRGQGDERDYYSLLLASAASRTARSRISCWASADKASNNAMM
nr:MAG TPA: hypothetical protein [Siphoviridae sp. ctedi74]